MKGRKLFNENAWKNMEGPRKLRKGVGGQKMHLKLWNGCGKTWLFEE